MVVHLGCTGIKSAGLMANLGATCHFSVLAYMLSCSGFIVDIFKGHPPSAQECACMMCAMRPYVSGLLPKHTTRARARADMIFDAYAKSISHLGVTITRDGQEDLHEVISHMATSFVERSCNAAFSLDWIQLTTLTYTERLECTECPAVRYANATMRGIDVAIRAFSDDCGPKDLSTIMRDLFSVRELVYCTCSHDPSHKHAHKTTVNVRFPKMLFVCLKRYSTRGGTTEQVASPFTSDVINDVVRLPKEVLCSEWCDAHAATEEDVSQESDVGTYMLSGVAMHIPTALRGTTEGLGHYTYACPTGNDDSSSWTLFDDARKPVEFRCTSQLMSRVGTGVDQGTSSNTLQQLCRNAYVVIYTLKTTALSGGCSISCTTLCRLAYRHVFLLTDYTHMSIVISSGVEICIVRKVFAWFATYDLSDMLMDGLILMRQSRH